MPQQEFGDFEIVVEEKRQPGTIQGEIPEKLATYLQKTYKDALGQSKELVLKAATEKDAKLLSSYAKAWGARQDPKLRITKVPNRRGMPESVARLSVALDAEVPEENRPGRKPNGK